MTRSIRPVRSHNLFIAALAALILFSPGPRCGAAEAAPRSSIEAKLALEGSLEKRIQMVLSEALGTSDIIVIISTELQEEQKKPVALDFLPGIPEKEKVGEISISSSLTMIKKISATLILDRHLPSEDFKLAKKLAAGLLGLPPEREDLITVEKMDFRKARPFSPSDLLTPPNLWNLIWILLAASLGLFTVFAFLKPFAVSARDLVGALGARAAAGGTQEQERERLPERLPAPLAESAPKEKKPDLWQEPPRKSPFWFLTPENAGNLAFILQSCSAEDIMIVLSYAPESVASALVEALYPRSMEALAALPRATLMPEAKIKNLEAALFSALDYVVGSEEKTIGIIERLPEEMQETATLSFSARDPEFAARLSGAIARFGNLGELEPAQAQMLVRRIPMRNLALALKNSALAQAFLEKLSEGMQERFRQELDLTRNPGAEVQRAERMRVAQELKKLVQEGFITLKKAGAERPQPPEPAPQAPAQEAAGLPQETAPQAEPHRPPPPPAPAERQA